MSVSVTCYYVAHCPQIKWPKMMIHCMSQFCVCSSSSVTLTWAHLYNDAQLAKWLESGLTFAAHWAEPLGLCLIFHPRLLCSMRISGQRSRRGSLQCGGPYPASACSLGCCPAGQGWSHGQNQNQCGKGMPQVWLSRVRQTGGCCCKSLPNSLL